MSGETAAVSEPSRGRRTVVRLRVGSCLPIPGNCDTLLEDLRANPSNQSIVSQNTFADVIAFILRHCRPQPGLLGNGFNDSQELPAKLTRGAFLSRARCTRRC